MTTPDTSAVRAWAKDNGYEVADRGRLPADVTQAYLAATGGGAKKSAAAKKAAPATAVAKKAASAKPVAKKAAATAPATRAGGTAVKTTAVKTTALKDVLKESPSQPPVIEQEVVDVAPAPKPAATPGKGSPKPRPVSDDRRLVALGEEIAALTKRVEALEQSSGGSKSGSKGTRFRRRS